MSIGEPWAIYIDWRNTPGRLRDRLRQVKRPRSDVTTDQVTTIAVDFIPNRSQLFYMYMRSRLMLAARVLIKRYIK